MALFKRSRFNRCDVIVVEDRFGVPTRRPYFGPWPRLREVNFPDNGEHRMKAGDTWSNLALRYLGSSYHWWVICEFNRVVDPWADLRTFIDEGRLIIYPSITRLNMEILIFTRKGRRRTA